MSTIDDMVKAEGPAIGAAELATQLDPEAVVSSGGGGLDLSFLMKETGPGEIEAYLNHPLNARRSRGLAQMLRGFTGFFGDGLRAAIADIAFGGMEYVRERRNGTDESNKIHLLS
jgi:hypothetical protein